MQASTVQRTQEMDKARQIRRVQDVSKKNTAASDEQEVEESVSSPDELPGAGDEHHNRQQRKNTYSRRKPTDPDPEEDEGPNLDLTA